MTTTFIVILIAIGIAIIAVVLLVINYLYQLDEKENKLVKYVLFFDTKKKIFVEQRSDEVNNSSSMETITINDHSVLHLFNRFCSRESYYITTPHQAHKVYEIYVKSRKNDN